MGRGSLLILSVLIVALWSAALIDGSPVASRKLMPRVTLQDVAKIKGAVLTKGGKLLSCGVGLLDNKASLVSADCLDFKDGKVDSSVDYSLHADSGYDGATAQFDIKKITVHPDYDKKTKANNVALLEYNLDNNVTWYNYNSVDRSKWESLIYVQRVLTNVETGEWGASKMYMHSVDDDNQCSDLSPIFKANKDDFTCNEIVAQAPTSSLSSCKVPYDTVYGFTNNIVYQAGFFSHAVVEGGSDLCKYDTVRTYYILIADYLMWVNSITNRIVYYFMTPDGNSDPPQSNPNYKMTDVSSAAPNGANVITGNQYSLEGKDASSDSESNASDNASDPEDSSDASSSDSQGDSGLSTKNTIIIAVCCSVGTLILAVVVYFGVRKCVLKWGRTTDPYASSRVQDLLTDDIGGASFPAGQRQHRDSISEDMPYDRPPPAYPAGEQRPANNTNGNANPADALLYQPGTPGNDHRDEKG
ncbi:hypothetical protein H4R20_004237 [Coemansia guatemalensis]|uniref:Peptidase S1 domain-containing protein n=1 Tax=Coemansia guatemalensis TaxID=2761395 RepID=A0A9W8LSZ3_9FUNG|nr:hypothetical protein H4R20_004237 [Coemansia guatemalensis]